MTKGSGMHKIDKCGECGNDRYIVNRKHMCCNECNYIRLHGTDAILEKRKKYLKSTKSPKQISKKSVKQKVKSCIGL